MKLLLIAEKYPPIVGGGETHLHQLAVGLSALGHEVTVVTEAVGEANGAAGYRDGTDGVRVVEVHGLADACQNLALKDGLETVSRILRTERYELVHVFNYVPAITISLIRDLVRSPLVVSLFETHVPGVRVFDLFEDYELERSLQRSLAASIDADLIVCGSQAYVDWARDGGFRAPTEMIEFGTDLGRFAAAGAMRTAERERYGWTEDFVVLVPARPVPRKRIEDAIVGIARLGERRGNARLVLTAPTGRTTEGYARVLRELADKLGVTDRVSWVEGLSWEDMPGLYAAADAVVLPSSHEGWGIALSEAMAAGRPVITTDIEGHDEVVRDGETGHLYPPGDVSALARQIELVMTTDQSAIVAEALAEAVRRFDRATVASRHSDLYAAVVRRTREGNM
ncbi:glycosyltransferase family 4 protein [Nocardia sp. NPDC051929]|uniref:glycosyltransferase family 4 protein n=1 Tax=Nocardia sp. NPDC051929 TaxID=3364327 RepID=UPI0037C81897